MILGVVPIIPKRKEQPEIEIKIEEAEGRAATKNKDGVSELKKIG